MWFTNEDNTVSIRLVTAPRRRAIGNWGLALRCLSLADMVRYFRAAEAVAATPERAAFLARMRQNAEDHLWNVLRP